MPRKKKVPPAIQEAFEKAMVRFYHLEILKDQLREVGRGLHPYNDVYREPSHAEEIANHTHGLIHVIYKKQEKAMQDAMMMGLAMPPETQAKLREVARLRYLSDKKDGAIPMAIMRLLDPTGTEPGSYASDMEDRFRDQIREAFAIENYDKEG